ncbi:hypothetical protein [Halomonas piscis]|uniref:hypothetical protein n=1 Tax=Halomonas piscis TaxID=3031727 RepID=UPI0028A2A14D|nr:hypothetical protein [Halomonas piscis]
MEFFGNKVNGSYLRDVLPSSDDDVELVKAAIAYGSGAKTLGDAVNRTSSMCRIPSLDLLTADGCAFVSV